MQRAAEPFQNLPVNSLRSLLIQSFGIGERLKVRSDRKLSFAAIVATGGKQHEWGCLELGLGVTAER